MRISMLLTIVLPSWEDWVQPPFHRLNEFVPATAQAMARMSAWTANQRRFRWRETIRREGDPVDCVYYLMEGWVSSSILQRDGRRQIVKIHLPGDMLGFPSLALASAGETLDTLTDCLVCPIKVTDIGSLFDECPSIAAGLFLSAQKERVALMQNLSWVGNSAALGRVSAFLLDLYERLDAAGLVTDGAFECPLTQAHVGDMLGLTAIHINRTMKQLDQTGFIQRSRRQIRVLDASGLRNFTHSRPPQSAGKSAWERLGFPGRRSAD